MVRMVGSFRVTCEKLLKGVKRISKPRLCRRDRCGKVENLFLRGGVTDPNGIPRGQGGATSMEFSKLCQAICNANALVKR